MLDAVFTIHAPRWDGDRRALVFGFSHSQLGEFVETVTFPGAPEVDEPETGLALAQLAALALGTSYFKARPVRHIRTQFALSTQQDALARDLYTHGLGEFYVRNDIDFPPLIDIKADGKAREPGSVQGAAPVSPGKTIVAFGGGKDSHVALAAIARAGGDPHPVSVCLSGAVARRLEKMSLRPLTFIKREIDPRLIALNRAPGTLNGHVPVTAINSALLCLQAHFTGAGRVVFANERSASEATLTTPAGVAINHQHSKSFAFEQIFRAAVQEATDGRIDYFSILRPCGEVWTVRKLVAHCQPALPVFASCNRNFVFAGPSQLRPEQNWCNRCPKCVYTAILLASACPVDQFEAIMQGNPFADVENSEYLRQLTGIAEVKPWECVGDVGEVVTALSGLYADGPWADMPLLRAMKPELLARWPDFYAMRDALGDFLALSGDHFIPPDVLAALEGM